MKDKIYEPARHNETSPAEGMAAVNTHMEEETPLEEIHPDQDATKKDNERQRTDDRTENH